MLSAVQRWRLQLSDESFHVMTPWAIPLFLFAFFHLCLDLTVLFLPFCLFLCSQSLFNFLICILSVFLPLISLFISYFVPILFDSHCRLFLSSVFIFVIVGTIDVSYLYYSSFLSFLLVLWHKCPCVGSIKSILSYLPITPSTHPAPWVQMKIIQMLLSKGKASDARACQRNAQSSLEMPVSSRSSRHESPRAWI